MISGKIGRIGMWHYRIAGMLDLLIADHADGC